MWLRRTKSKTRIHNSFSCSSFKDIQDLCSDENNTATTTNNNNNNNTTTSFPVPTTRVATVFHRVRRANSILAAFKDPNLPAIPVEQNGNAKDPNLPVLPSDRKGNANIASLYHEEHLKDPTLPVLPSEETKDSNLATVLEDPTLSVSPSEQTNVTIIHDPILPILPSETIQIQGAEKLIVIFFTSLRVVRPTFEACKVVRSILHAFRVKVDERDVTMDARFMDELHKIFGEDKESTKITLPKVFIDGRYIGGAEEVRQLHEAGELKKYVEGLLPAESGTCDICGGYGFTICDECNGSRKIYSEKGETFRTCTACNENGLLRCPSCSSAPL